MLCNPVPGFRPFRRSFRRIFSGAKYGFKFYHIAGAVPQSLRGFCSFSEPGESRFGLSEAHRCAPSYCRGFASCKPRNFKIFDSFVSAYLLYVDGSPVNCFQIIRVLASSRLGHERGRRDVTHPQAAIYAYCLYECRF